jgi:hypothetical protein
MSSDDIDNGIDLLFLLRDYTHEHALEIFDKCDIKSFMKFYYNHSIFNPEIEKLLLEQELQELQEFPDLCNPDCRDIDPEDVNGWTKVI